MSKTNLIFFIAAHLLYLAAFLTYCFRIIFHDRSLSVTGLRVTIAALVLHIGTLIPYLSGQGYPYFKTSFDALQLTSLSIILAYVVLSFFSTFLTTGVVFVGLGLAIYSISLTHMQAFQASGNLLANPWAFIHLLCIFVAISVFVLSLATGFLYLFQENRIRNKVTGGFADRLPPLEVLDRIHYRALYIGFVLFTIGIITGAGWSKSALGVYLVGDLKEFVSYGVWIFFALLLNLRVGHGWIGRKGILLSLVGFAGIIFLFLWTQK